VLPKHEIYAELGICVLPKLELCAKLGIYAHSKLEFCAELSICVHLKLEFCAELGICVLPELEFCAKLGSPLWYLRICPTHLPRRCRRGPFWGSIKPCFHISASGYEVLDVNEGFL
jgi:hypothetical protein